MNSTRGLGPVAAHRHRRRPARHAHPAARAAGDLRPVAVLAGAADVRLAPSRPSTGHLGADRARHRPPAADGLGRDRAGPRRACRSGCSSSTPTACPPQDSFTTKPESVAGEEVLARHFPAGAGPAGRGHRQRPRPPPQLQPALRRDRTGIDRGRASRWSGTACALPRGHAASRADSRGGRATGRPGPRRGARGDRRRRQGRRRDRDRPRHQHAPTRHDNGLIIPLVLLVVLVILALLLRAVVAPLVLIATVVLSFAAALGVSALVFEHVFGFAGADTVVPAVRRSCSWSRWASTTTSS